MSVIRETKGYCPCCKTPTVFVANGYWLRDEYKCSNCNSKPRNRALSKIVQEIRPNYKQLKIHESSPTSRQIRRMVKECEQYTYSYFCENISLGERMENGATNENLERLTFEDNSFDIFITQDVMEHVLDPIAAFRENERVLKVGGVHVFTVPIYLFQKTRPRVQFDGKKWISILPEIYHGNPISKEGALVTWDWGDDIAEIVDRNCKSSETKVYQFQHTKENYENGLEADFLQVIVTQKLDS